MGFPSVQDQGDREIKEGGSHGFKENDVVKAVPHSGVLLEALVSGSPGGRGAGE